MKIENGVSEWNLDDEAEVERFFTEYGGSLGALIRLEEDLKFLGDVKRETAKALLAYAWNKRFAMILRRAGAIEEAEAYEGICERVYDALPEEVQW